MSASTFKEMLLTESQNYEVRQKGSSTGGEDVPSEYHDKIVGWFSNKFNPAFGWVLTTLEDHELEEFNPKGEKGIFRTYSCNGKGTSIIKINAKTGKYAFVDNEKYEGGSAKVPFERLTKYKRLVIDFGNERFFI